MFFHVLLLNAVRAFFFSQVAQWGNRWSAYLAVPGRSQGWSGGAMALGKLPVPRRPTNLN